MRRIVVTVFCAALIAASTAQVATAAEHRHARTTERVTVSEQFRNANNSATSPSQPSWPYSGYSAPAGR